MSELEKRFAESYKKLIPYLPSDIVLKDMINDCQRVSAEQTQRIQNFREDLIQKGILVGRGGGTYLHKDDCLLQPEWSGVYDISDRRKMEETMTKASIGWTCQPLECHVEADLPVHPSQEKSIIDFVNKVEKCCVDIVHTHEDPIRPEKHVHVVCKGIHPNDLGWEVNRLLKILLQHRGHDIEAPKVIEQELLGV